MVVATACAHREVPHAQLANAQASLAAAQDHDAHDNPRVDLHVSQARACINRAQELMDAHKIDAARFALLRAQSDAELALLLAKEVVAEQTAQRALQDVQALRAELGGP